MRTVVFVVALIVASSAFAKSQMYSTDGNKVSVLSNGRELVEARLKLIRNAQKFVYIKTFILSKDPSEYAVYDALCAKAREHVDVRLALDAMGKKQGGNPLESKTTPYSIEWFKGCGIRFELYAPLRWGIVPYVLYSQHDKSIVSENAAIVGGTNFSKDYSDHGIHSDKWYDFDIYVQGPAACSYQDVFVESWTGLYLKEVSLVHQRLGTHIGKYGQSKIASLNERFSPSTLVKECGARTYAENAPITVIFNDPYFSKDRPFLEYFMKSLDDAEKSADKRVRMYAPYFVPSSEMQKRLIKAVKNGVRVQVLTNSEQSIDPEAFPAYTAMLQRTKSIIKGGVEVYMWNPVNSGKFPHAKNNVFHKKGGCFSDISCFVGSHNFDIRGDQYSSEMISVIKDREFIARHVSEYDEDLTYAEKLTVKSRKAYLRKAKLTTRAISRVIGWAL